MQLVLDGWLTILLLLLQIMVNAIIMDLMMLQKNRQMQKMDG